MPLRSNDIFRDGLADCLTKVLCIGFLAYWVGGIIYTLDCLGDMTLAINDIFDESQENFLEWPGCANAFNSEISLSSWMDLVLMIDDVVGNIILGVLCLTVSGLWWWCELWILSFESRPELSFLLIFWILEIFFDMKFYLPYIQVNARSVLGKDYWVSSSGIFVCSNDWSLSLCYCFSSFGWGLNYINFLSWGFWMGFGSSITELDYYFWVYKFNTNFTAALAVANLSPLK